MNVNVPVIVHDIKNLFGHGHVYGHVYGKRLFDELMGQYTRFRHISSFRIPVDIYLELPYCKEILKTT